MSRPGVAEVAEYRRHVDESMARLLDGPLTPEVNDLVELGLHHEQQHQELLLMDIKHVLSCNPLQPAYTTVTIDEPRRRPRRPTWVEHDGGLRRRRARTATVSPSTTSSPATPPTSSPSPWPTAP